MKKIILILAVLVIFAALAVFGLILESNQLTRLIVTIGSSNVLGAPVHIDSVLLDKTGHKINITGFKLYNPKGFQREVLADIPTINAEYGRDVLSERVLHLNKLKLNVKTLLVIRNKDGALNVDELRIVKDVMQIKMLIDTLVLTADKVVYEDFTKGEKPVVKSFDINIEDKTYSNITTAEQLGGKVLSEILAKTTIRDAAVLSTAALAGIALAPPIGLPIAAAILISGNDTVKADFSESYETVYQACVTTLEKIGKLTQKDEKTGTLRGTVKGANIKIGIKNLRGKVHVTVSGRKVLRPNHEAAGGVLYEISQELAHKQKRPGA